MAKDSKAQEPPVADVAVQPAQAEERPAERPAETAKLLELPKPDRKVELILRERLANHEDARQFHLATLAVGTLPEDLLDPAYWANVSPMLRPRDRIEAWSEDGSWMAEYVVLACDRAWARVTMLWQRQLSRSDEDLERAAPGYSVVYRGFHNQWSVIRLKDSAIVHEGARQRSEAEAWLRSHVQAGA